MVLFDDKKYTKNTLLTFCKSMKFLLRIFFPTQRQLRQCLLVALAPIGAAVAQTPSWRVAIAGSTTQTAGSVSQTLATTVDASGNVFVTGYFTGSVTFGNTTITSSGNNSFVPAGSNDIFVAKWVPGNGTGTGSWAWAVKGGGNADDKGLGIAVSGTKVYVTGYITNATNNFSNAVFENTIVYGTSKNATADLVLVCYTDNTTSATLNWTQVGGGAGADQGQGVAVSGTNVYVAGFITNDISNANAVVFGNSGKQNDVTAVAQYGASTTSSSDLVVAKYTDNSTSATLGWTQVGGGTGADVGQAIAAGSNGVYVTGYLSNDNADAAVVRFGGAGTAAGTVQQNGAASPTSSDLVLAKYTDNGPTATLGWTQVGGGTGADQGLGLVVNGTTAYVSGYLTNSFADAQAVRFGGSGTTAGTARQYGASTTSSADLLVARYTDNGASATSDWTQVGGGSGADQGLAIAASGSSVYVTGYTTNDNAAGNTNGVKFGGSGTTAGTVDQLGASSTASADIVLANYTDNTTSAALNWTQIGGGTATDQGQGIGFVGSTIYVAGYVVPAATFGSFTVANPAGRNVNFFGQLSVVAPLPLPIELAAFSATLAVSNTAVRLDWTTASEVNNARFEVERSPDGVSFTTIGVVAGAGSSSFQHTYTLADAALPSGEPMLYYRLRSVDFDGTASYSPVRAVALNLARSLAQSLSLFPNPASGATILAGAAAGAPVQLLDGLGRVIFTTTVDANGTASLVLPSLLLGGMYVVRSGTQAIRLAIIN